MPDCEAILFYDGACGLCNRLNHFVLRRDPGGRFRFAALQSAFARDLLARHGRDATRLDTFYVVTTPGGPNERVLERARAALHVLGGLGLPWRAFGVLGVLPTSVLDLGYGLVARSRYRLCGKRDRCTVPEPLWAERFIGVDSCLDREVSVHLRAP